jgi:hypothetical protein
MRDVVTENWLKAEVLGSRSRPKGTPGQWRSARCIQGGEVVRWVHRPGSPDAIPALYATFSPPSTHAPVDNSPLGEGRSFEHHEVPSGRIRSQQRATRRGAPVPALPASGPPVDDVLRDRILDRAAGLLHVVRSRSRSRNDLGCQPERIRRQHTRFPRCRDGDDHSTEQFPGYEHGGLQFGWFTQ